MSAKRTFDIETKKWRKEIRKRNGKQIGANLEETNKQTKTKFEQLPALENKTIVSDYFCFTRFIPNNIILNCFLCIQIFGNPPSSYRGIFLVKEEMSALKSYGQCC